MKQPARPGRSRAGADRLNIGLLCSKTFDDAIFDELFEAKYGLQARGHQEDEHQGRLPDLDARRRLPRGRRSRSATPGRGEGCKTCPDFAAEHADISTGGIGAFNDWTLTIVRTEAGREVMDGMLADGWIDVRPGDDDPGAIELLHKLARKQRSRWPDTAFVDAPRLVGA